MTSNLQFQREIARIALKASQGNDFALAGSGAIREHGLTDRPTEDVDLFTVQQAAPQFESTVNAVIKALRDNGYSVREDKRLQGFARLNVSDSQGLSSTEIDMGIDWRSSPPVHLEIGEVLDEQDAIGNKIAALFSRGEARDYLDLDSIRQTGRYSDQDLLDLAKNTDPVLMRIFLLKHYVISLIMDSKTLKSTILMKKDISLSKNVFRRSQTLLRTVLCQKRNLRRNRRQISSPNLILSQAFF
jgi:hypothetical protein